MPSVAFLVYGCRLNQAEAAEWQSQLAARGVPIVDKALAEVLCVHSCAVTEPALHEIEKTLRAHRAQHPQTKIILSGCAATLLPTELRDLAIPHADKAHWLERVFHFIGPAAPATAPFPLPRRRTRASLIVQDGCDRFCAYCIVPHLRGAPTSVPMARLLRRAETLFAAGYREIVLTGCHLALYRDPESGANFVELLRRLADVNGEGRYRIGSLEPCVLDDAALIRLIAAHPQRICPYLHLPIQTASTPLLHAMGRHYTHDNLRQLLDTLCEHLPGCGLGADWIVGLPGETDNDARITRELLTAYPFTGTHIFPYSRRPGTPAATFPNQVPSHLLKARIDALNACAKEIRRATLRNALGTPLTVIPEHLHNGAWEGWSAQRFRCRIPAPATRGALTPFTPTQLSGDLLL